MTGFLPSDIPHLAVARTVFAAQPEIVTKPTVGIQRPLRSIPPVFREFESTQALRLADFTLGYILAPILARIANLMGTQWFVMMVDCTANTQGRFRDQGFKG